MNASIYTPEFYDNINYEDFLSLNENESNFYIKLKDDVSVLSYESEQNYKSLNSISSINESLTNSIMSNPDQIKSSNTGNVNFFFNLLDLEDTNDTQQNIFIDLLGIEDQPKLSQINLIEIFGRYTQGVVDLMKSKEENKQLVQVYQEVKELKDQVHLLDQNFQNFKNNEITKLSSNLQKEIDENMRVLLLEYTLHISKEFQSMKLILESLQPSTNSSKKFQNKNTSNAETQTESDINEKEVQTQKDSEDEAEIIINTNIH